jgi:predicted DsbA family dithiol-disulfide isomerase
MRIELVSDIVCPWCAIGVHALENALSGIGSELGSVAVEFQPFELNPDMSAEGADTLQYLSAKFGIDESRVRGGQAALRERGEAVGFTFGERARVWNTFDGHRLLYWAAREGGPHAQYALGKALLTAYHGQGQNISDREVLTRVVGTVAGLDVARAAGILAGHEFSTEVRALERRWRHAGVDAVPTAVVDGRYVISGAQPPEVFARALRQIAAQHA